jgi:hypothetical protein
MLGIPRPVVITHRLLFFLLRFSFLFMSVHYHHSTVHIHATFRYDAFHFWKQRSGCAYVHPALILLFTHRRISSTSLSLRLAVPLFSQP